MVASESLFRKVVCCRGIGNTPGRNVMTKRWKLDRDAESGRFVVVPSSAPAGSFSEKYVGKIGSYNVRRVDDERFKNAIRAASSTLKNAKSPRSPKD